MKSFGFLFLSVCLAATACLSLPGCNSSSLGKNARNDTCDDGTQPTCEMKPPDCMPYEIMAYQESCYLCVNPDTCRPWGEAGCQEDGDCSPSQYCEPCASSSCPDCDDCVAGCEDHGCATEAEPECNMERPDCGEGNVAVVDEGCWVCVEMETCQPARDASCDDGTVPTCEMVPPVCEPYEILAYRNSCYICLNPSNCLAWGQAECQGDFDCAPTHRCNPCGTSSCPECLDCVPACTPHGCPTEDTATCNMVRPDCTEGVAVIQDGCWVCVGLEACQPLRDTSCDDGTVPT